ncbi:MAG: transcription antitermination protein NusB [Aggregatilineales bacterium]
MEYPEYDYNEQQQSFDPDGENVVNREVIPHEETDDTRSQLRRVVLQLLYQLDNHDHTDDEVLSTHLVYDLNGGTVQDSQPLLEEFFEGLRQAGDPDRPAEYAFMQEPVKYDEKDKKVQRTQKDLSRLLENVAGYLSSNNNQALQDGLERYLSTLASSLGIYKSGWLRELDGVSTKTIAIVLYTMGLERRFHLAVTAPAYDADTTEILKQLTDTSFTGWHEIERLVRRIYARKAYMDDVLQSYAPDYPLDQIAIIDRNVLRLALHELLEDTVPLSVAISEAVLLAKYFGAEGASRFVNGVLGAIAPGIDEIREMLELLSS